MCGNAFKNKRNFYVLSIEVCLEIKLESQLLQHNSILIRDEDGNPAELKSVELINQTSVSPCVRWASFAHFGSAVIVKDGCQGRFNVCYSTGVPQPSVPIIDSQGRHNYRHYHQYQHHHHRRRYICRHHYRHYPCHHNHHYYFYDHRCHHHEHQHRVVFVAVIIIIVVVSVIVVTTTTTTTTATTTPPSDYSARSLTLKFSERVSAPAPVLLFP